MGHLLVSGAIGVAGLALLALTVVSAALSLVGGLGLPALVRTVTLTRALADVQRRRVGVPVSPYGDRSVLTGTGGSGVGGRPPGLLGRVVTILRTPATWRDLLWLLLPVQLAGALVAAFSFVAALQLVLLPLNWVLTPASQRQNLAGRGLLAGLPVSSVSDLLVFVPLILLAVAVTYRAPRALVAVEVVITRRLLAPSAAARLAARVERLTTTRSQALDASAVELRRIERDLHDGAQARLVSVAMNLGLAEDLFDRDPAAARTRLAEARVTTQSALAELRHLVRGIRPPLLADRGIDGALRSLALDTPVPVDLDVRLGRRLDAALETAAYFTVVEAVTNAVKHSGAHKITVSVVDDEDALLLRVADDGRGGADPTRGTGLRGIEQRLAAFDGRLRLTSPLGGPTTVEAEVPCAS